MGACVPVEVLERWIADLQSILKGEARERRSNTDYLINKGMRHGIAQISHRMRTWVRHQRYLQTLNQLKRKFLMVRRVNLSDGRFRKLEWYENDLFLTLAWRHGMHEETGELVLEMQHVQALSTKYLVYEGDLSFDQLAGLAREGGQGAIRNEGNRREWVEKVWH